MIFHKCERFKRLKFARFSSAEWQVNAQVCVGFPEDPAAGAGLEGVGVFPPESTTPESL